jgi:hypothetical protein
MYATFGRVLMNSALCLPIQRSVTKSMHPLVHSVVLGDVLWTVHAQITPAAI